MYCCCILTVNMTIFDEALILVVCASVLFMKQYGESFYVSLFSAPALA